MSRKIIHIDMDCFFAAIEMRDNPNLRHVPLAIGGSVKSRGVISTCNYPARAFGVHSAMATSQAMKRCPQLILLAGNMEKYKTVSRQLQHIYSRYSNLIEPLSLDEAYLDVSDSSLFAGSATRIAEDLRRVIKTETGLTASAGVAPNKFLAKIASDENKPDGLKVIAPDQVAGFISTLPLQRLPGVGSKTAERLAQLGLYTCKDIQQAPLAILVRHFGAQADTLLKCSQGIDLRPVCNRQPRKSVGVEHTFPEDLSEYQQAEQQLIQLLPTLQQRLQQCQSENQIQKIGVKLKFSDFRLTTVEKQGNSLQQDNLLALLSEAWQRRQQQGVRLIGIQAGLKLVPQEQLQFPF